MPPEGRRSMRSIWPVMMTGGRAVLGLQGQLEVELLVERLGQAADLAGPEVVEEGRDAPLVALLGGLVAEAGRGPVGAERGLEVLAGRRRLAARGALAALAGEGLERGVGGRTERERRDRLLARRHPVDVAERVLERARVVHPERRVAVASPGSGATWRRLAPAPSSSAMVRKVRGSRPWARASSAVVAADRASVASSPGQPVARGRAPRGRRRVGRLHEPDELARAQAQREPAFAGARAGA